MPTWIDKSGTKWNPNKMSDSHILNSMLWLARDPAHEVLNKDAMSCQEWINLFKNILLNRMKPCQPGQHQLVDILKSEKGGVYNIARWCEVCGAVVIDFEGEFDIPGGVKKMTLPSLMRFK